MAINDHDDWGAEPKFTIVKPVEYLGLWTATVKAEPAVVISVRMNTDSFAVTNLSLTASQAKRLVIDLASRFAESDLLLGSDPDPQIRSAFDRIVSDRDINNAEKPH